MSTLKNDLLLRAARGEQIERPPVWLMRQAGRILPQYRSLRASLSGFKELVETPELACEVTIQPVDELGVDAAIIFSDILVIPEAMGLPYEMIEKKGPWFPKTVAQLSDLDILQIAVPEESLKYTTDAIRLTKSALNGRVPVIGFAGAPWTIFCYMTEGSGSKTFSKAKAALYRSPEFSNKLIDMITESTIAYLKAQIEAGADLLQLFDSWAGILTPEQYRQFALPSIARICNEINEVPLTVFSKGAWFIRKELGELNCQTIGVDWNMPIAETRELIGPGKTLQGNLDPCQLYAPLEEVKKQTINMLQKFGGQRHIANLGHGVYPDTPLDAVKCFVDTVKGWESVA